MLQVHMTTIYIIVATALSTLCGGFVALRYKKYAHIFAGLTAGTLLAVIFLEILPEVFSMNSGLTLPVFTVVLGFVIFHIIEKVFSLHHSHIDNDHGHSHAHTHPTSKTVAAIALICHSLLDGLSIGFAYQVSPTFGLLLAIGVIAHDFSDGFNTVSLMRHSPHAKYFLLLDALAPALGVLVGLHILISSHVLGLVLGLFAGILLYVSTQDILPEAHCNKKSHTVQHLLALLIGVVYITLIVSMF